MQNAVAADSLIAPTALLAFSALLAFLLPARHAIAMSIKDLEEWSRMDDLINGYLCEKESLSLRFMMEKGYSRSGNVGNNDPDLLEAVSRRKPIRMD